MYAIIEYYNDDIENYKIFGKSSDYDSLVKKVRKLNKKESSNKFYKIVTISYYNGIFELGF